MSTLFNISVDEVLNLQFTDFLKLALDNIDHHWNPQINYIKIDGIDNILLFDIKEDMNILINKLKELGYDIPEKKI